MIISIDTGDLIPAIYIVGSKAKQGSSRGFSAREWPINGGLDTGTESCSYTELVITGHADGSIRFWDGSSTTMQALYKIKTSKFFERNKKHVEGVEDDPYAVTQITMCPESKSLCVAGASAQVIFFSFRKKDTETETKSMEIPIVYEVSNMPHGGSKPDSNSPNNPGILLALISMRMAIYLMLLKYQMYTSLHSMIFQATSILNSLHGLYYK